MTSTSFFRSRLVPALLALALAACPPNIDTGDGGDGPIVAGPEGGIFIRNGYAIDIPRGALSAEAQIFVTIVDTGIPDVPMRKRVSYGYRFSPSTLKFNSPVKLYLPWLDERVPQAVDPGTFDMRRNQGAEAFAQLPGAKTTLMPFKAVEAQTDRLGLFWITSPTEPNVARLELSPMEATLRVGETQQFTARVVSPTGETIAATVTWSVLPPRVASVDMNGLVTAKDPGTATVTARAGMQSATAKVFVVGTATGPSTYVHQNPFPTGNDLYGGALAPGGLGTIFAGANGTVLAQGPMSQWTRLFSAPGVTLTAVGGTTADNAVAIGRSGTSGVLVEFKGATAAPAVKVFPPTQISDLVALWFDGTHGMGVGAGNDVVIRRNGMWTTEYHPSFETLLSVIGDGNGGFVVVGDLGSLYKWDPARKVWDSLYDMRLAVKLDAARLVDFATGEAWAVGGNKLWHFQGGGWTAENLPATPVLDKVTTIALFDDRVFIGGQVKVGMTPPPSLGAVLVRSTGGADAGMGASWTSFDLRGPQIPRGAFGGGVSSPTGYVVGDYGAVWAWMSSTAMFNEVSQGFYGDVADLAVTSGDVVAAVNECTNVLCRARTGRVMHQAANGTWEALGTFPAANEQVLAVVAKSATEVLASTESGGVYRWDGTMWSSVPVNNQLGAILDMKYCGNTLWGAGENGTVYRGSATTIANAGSIAGTGNLTALHCPSELEIWAAGDDFFAARMGNGTWMTKTSDQVNQAAWKAVWAPGGGEGFAFGDARYGVYWNTAELSAVEALGGISPDVVTGMWGSSIDNLYMVGLAQFPAVFGFAMRFDGINWTLIDSGAQRKSTAIDGNSPTNIWIGTAGGGVLKAVPPP